MQKISTTLQRVEKLTEDVWQFDFKWDEPVDFKAGQFFLIQVPEKGEERACTRAYSIASPPSEKDHFSLCVKLVPGGRASEYLRSLEIGDEVGFQAPFGHFVLNEGDEKAITMVATGTGLAPFMSMLPMLEAAEFKSAITVFFGVRHESDLFYVDQLRSWEKSFANFTARISLSRPEDSWEGDKGRVTELLNEHEVSAEDSMVYICGNGQMVKDVKAMMENRGLQKENIRFEQFTTA